MAVLDTFRPSTVAASHGLVSKVFSATVGTIKDWADTRATRKALGQLTARELDDIGLMHADIDRITRR